MESTTNFPYMGITTDLYIMPASWASHTSMLTSFFELIGISTSCNFVSDGVPYYLSAQSALTVTSTVSVSETGQPLITEPGSEPSTAASASKTSGPYWLVAATAVTAVSSATSPAASTGTVLSGTETKLQASENLPPNSGTPTSDEHHASAVIISLTDRTSKPAPVLTIAGSVITANSISEYHYHTQILTPGGQFTMSGTTVSLAPFGTALIVAGVTHPVSPVAEPPPPAITIAGTIVTPNAAGVYTVASQTLIPGGSAIRVSGTPYALAPLASYTAIESTIYASGPTGVLILPTLTIDGSAITPNAASEYIVRTQMIVPGGPAVTISGKPYSLAPAASFIVEGGTTEILAVQTSVVGLGGYIISGFGALPTGTGAGTNTTLYRGGAGLSDKDRGMMTEWLFVIGVFLLRMVW